MTHVSPCAMLSLKIKVGSKMQIYKQTDSKSVCVCVCVGGGGGGSCTFKHSGRGAVDANL